MDLKTLYFKLRQRSEDLCKPLATEDYVIQPVVDVSPPKWHLGHTTWFFETFILQPFLKDYKEYNPSWNFIFNSYYESLGDRVVRNLRGNLSRPQVNEIYAYRKYVDDAMGIFLDTDYDTRAEDILKLGLNHEQQHQELLITDIKFILGNNPLLPVYHPDFNEGNNSEIEQNFISIPEGIYEIGIEKAEFCFDNEFKKHKQYLQAYEISNALVTNAQYLNFIEDGGYRKFKFWHAEGWDWIKENKINSPLYWDYKNGIWQHFTLNGVQEINLEAPVTHISYYEAFAFANWSNLRLPTEFEWEAAASKFKWGKRWEWTESAYLPYPGYQKPEGAIGEYNGKFMVNQKVLRGASVATPDGHSRITYRNFFHPYLRWQYFGIRLAK